MQIYSQISFSKKSIFLPLPIFSALLFLVLSSVVLGGCATQGYKIDKAQSIYLKEGMVRENINTDYFPLTSVNKLNKPHGAEMTVFISGAPHPSLADYLLVKNPTPAEPHVLRLAAADPGKNVIYLSPPCAYFTYSTLEKCENEFFAMDGVPFNRQTIDGYVQALEHYKKLYNTKGFHLVGYEEGGAIALLLAQYYPDILSLRTVDSVFDTANVAAKKNLQGAVLNPADFASQLAHLPQHHFIGKDPKGTKALQLATYKQRMGASSSCLKVTMMSEADGPGDWIKQWPVLARLPVQCTQAPVLEGEDCPPASATDATIPLTLHDGHPRHNMQKDASFMLLSLHDLLFYDILSPIVIYQDVNDISVSEDGVSFHSDRGAGTTDDVIEGGSGMVRADNAFDHEASRDPASSYIDYMGDTGMGAPIPLSR